MPARSNLCLPGDAPRGGRVLNYLIEALSLSPAQLQAIALTLQGRANTTTPVTDTYKVPADMDFIAVAMSGYILLPNLATEPTAILTWLNLEPSERIYVKAQNCLLKLENIDRSLKVTESRDLPLVSITPPFGAPINWALETSLVVPSNHTLKATFSLQDSTAATLGAASDYGVRLDGVLIPHDLLKNLR